jgi:hypothetical protein
MATVRKNGVWVMGREVLPLWGGKAVLWAVGLNTDTSIENTEKTP